MLGALTLDRARGTPRSACYLVYVEARELCASCAQLYPSLAMQEEAGISMEIDTNDFLLNTI